MQHIQIAYIQTKRELEDGQFVNMLIFNIAPLYYRNADVFSKSDPFCVILSKNAVNSPWSEIGSYIEAQNSRAVQQNQ